MAKGDGVHAALFAARQLAASERSPELIRELSRLAARSANLAADELNADDRAAVTVASAYYDLGRLLELDDEFFEAWEESTDPASLDGDKSRPRLRSRVVRNRLRAMQKALPVFHAANRSLEVGRYGDALALYRKFFQAYQGAEVEQNMGVAHLLSALDEMACASRQDLSRTFPAMAEGFISLPARVEGPRRFLGWKVASGPIQGQPISAGMGFDPRRVRSSLKQARMYLERAVRHDTGDVSAHTNLGLAYELLGNHTKAVGAYDDALDLDSVYVPALVGRAVATLVEPRFAESAARRDLEKAVRVAPSDPVPLFDLALLEQRKSRSAAVRSLLERAVSLGLHGRPLKQALEILGDRAPVPPGRTDAVQETFRGLVPGSDLVDWTQAMGKPASVSSVALESYPLDMMEYPGPGARLYVVGGAVEMVELSGGSSQRTAGGRGIGDGRDDLVNAYGRPGRRVDQPHGSVLLWPDRGLGFELQGGRVVAWYLYLP